MFPIDMQAAASNSENQNEEEPVVRDGVFTICLKSEEQPATLNNYRYDDTLLGIPSNWYDYILLWNTYYINSGLGWR